MHSYQHNIKTFNSATRHLTRVERALYRDLIELYYDTEQPLPAADFDRLARLVMANSDEEKDALRYVLSEFFELTGDVYSHDTCDEIIEKYHNQQTAKAKAGKASAESRRKKAEERKRARTNNKSTPEEQTSTPVEQVLNSSTQQETRNKKPVKEKEKKEKTLFSLPPEVDYQAWCEFDEHRRSSAKLKKGWTNLARTKAANILRELSPQQQQECVNYSIVGGYPGLYPEQVKHEKSSGIDRPRSAAARVSNKLDELAREAVLRGETV